jgi:hypothetical protein
LLLLLADEFPNRIGLDDMRSHKPPMVFPQFHLASLYRANAQCMALVPLEIPLLFLSLLLLLLLFAEEAESHLIFQWNKC